MHRLTIVTEESFIILGKSGIESFMDAVLEKDIPPVYFIDDFFLSRLKLMETHTVGFTQSFKSGFLELMTAQKGKYCVLTDDVLKKSDGRKEKIYMNIVKLLNEGKTLEEASIIAKLIFS